MDTRRIARTLRLIVGLLAEQRFYDLYVLDDEKEVPPEYMPEFLDDYEGTITMPDKDE